MWLRALIGFGLALLAAAAPAATLHRGLGPAPDALDPQRAQGLNAFNLLRDLHEGLLARDAHGRAVAGVARTWTVSDDGLTWHFELDPAARWSDGSAIVATDFERAFERARDPATASPTAGWLDPIRSLQAEDSERLTIVLERPVAWFEELLTLPILAPVPPADAVAYSGPFVLERQVPGSRFELRRNQQYRQADRIALDAVVWHVTEDPVSELARFRAGELHITETVPPGRHDWLQRELGRAYRVAPYLGSFFLACNLSRPPCADDPALRRALSLSIDRRLLVERVLGSGELPATRLVPPGLPGWPEHIDRDGFDPAAARAELERARYRPGRDQPIELRYNSSLTQRRLAAAVAAMWKQHLGVATRLVNEEWKVFVTNRRQGRLTELVRGGWIADWADPGNFLQLFAGDNPLNYSFFRDPEYDRLLTAAERLRGSARIDRLRHAEQRLLDRAVIVPLYYYVSRHLVDPRVQGWHDNPMDIHASRWLSLEPGT
ncbi:MAG: peptide ABC transporter substrate-binding protein [Wenzhouxiangellaceae bacterium]|nr:peptide ABC transporter substrate-binding protein [Wenzhouxiangellaceae bacterium]